MKTKFILILLLLFYFSCKKENNIGKIVLYTKYIDSLKKTKSLEEYSLLNKTCAGGVTGFYFKGKLVLIYSENGGEYTKYYKKSYIKNDRVLKIEYSTHIPKINQLVFNENHITYQDTIFNIYFSKDIIFETIYKDKIISRKKNSLLIKKLKDCDEDLIIKLTKKRKPTLTFLDEFVVPAKTSIKKSLIGGLSGIDYANGRYYLVVDDSKNPRFVTANINIQKDTIATIEFTDVVFLNDTTDIFYKENTLDLESIFVDETTQEVYLNSEGSIRHHKNPLVFVVDTLGNFIRNYPLPDMFLADSNAKPIHNATLEGSSKSIDGKGFWTAMESPLQIDGEEAKITKTNSPIRITYFDKSTKKATKQFAYQLEKIAKPKRGKFNVNGVTAILEFASNKFLIIERAYQSGYESYGNTIRIFEATIDENTTNILAIPSLKEASYTPLKKRLILDLATIQSKLTKGIIDNIEGITLGPTLTNGNRSIIIISDDNFNKYDPQINQFILFELKE